MRKLTEIFLLELRALVRSKTLALLLVACVGWVLVLPRVVRGDGTPEGLRELSIHYSLGGVFVLLVVALLASATGSVARERTAKRLQLTLVRPVRYFSIALGKIFAHVAVGAIALAAACWALAVATDFAQPCSHVLSPALPSPREAATKIYERLLADPETAKELKKTSKSVALRILENRVIDQYQTIPTNQTVRWTFDGLEGAAGDCAVRLRFSNQYAIRQEAFGTFALGDRAGVVSNMTLSVLKVPLKPVSNAAAAAADFRTLSFANCGKTSLMLCPRKDIHLLVPADAFGWNLARGCVVLLAVLALVVSVGTFLSAALGRPVALFVAFVLLIVSEMCPSVVSRYPDGLETDPIDHVGLCVTRVMASVTRPVSSLAPIEALAKDERVEPAEALRFAAVGLCIVPLAFSLLAAVALPRKQDDD